MSRGTIKVMVGRNGVTRIQEDTGDSVKVYSAKEWQEELKRRSGEKSVVEPKADKASKKEAKAKEEKAAEVAAPAPEAPVEKVGGAAVKKTKPRGRKK